jgi:hypothetical protein
MKNIDLSQVLTVGQFAEKVGTGSANVFSWVTKAEVKPAAKFGNTNVYLISELSAAMEAHSRNADGFRKLGYVHPDQHRALQDLHAESVQEVIQLQEENDRLANELEEIQDAADDLNNNVGGMQAAYAELLANFNGLQAELDATRSAVLTLSE